MNTVKRHSHGHSNPLRAWAREVRDLSGLHADATVHAGMPGILLSHMLNQLGYSDILAKPRADWLFWLQLASELGRGLFQVAANPRGTTTTIHVLGQDVEVPSGSGDESTAVSWTDVWGVARTLRDAKTLEVLHNFDPELLYGVGAHYDLHYYELVFAFRDTDRWEWDWETAAQRTIQHTQAPSLIVPKSAPLARAKAECILALGRKDEAAFNEALFEALNGHKAFLGSRNNRIHVDTLLSFELLGLCSVAHDMGLAISVESDYIPRWLYTQEPVTDELSAELLPFLSQEST